MNSKTKRPSLTALLREQPRAGAPDAAARSRDKRAPAGQRAAHFGMSEMDAIHG